MGDVCAQSDPMRRGGWDVCSERSNRPHPQGAHTRRAHMAIPRHLGEVAVATQGGGRGGAQGEVREWAVWRALSRAARSL